MTFVTILVMDLESFDTSTQVTFKARLAEACGNGVGTLDITIDVESGSVVLKNHIHTNDFSTAQAISLAISRTASASNGVFLGLNVTTAAGSLSISSFVLYATPNHLPYPQPPSLPTSPLSPTGIAIASPLIRLPLPPPSLPALSVPTQVPPSTSAVSAQPEGLSDGPMLIIAIVLSISLVLLASLCAMVLMIYRNQKKRLRKLEVRTTQMEESQEKRETQTLFFARALLALRKRAKIQSQAAPQHDQKITGPPENELTRRANLNYMARFVGAEVAKIEEADRLDALDDNHQQDLDPSELQIDLEEEFRI